ncbi:MAG: MerC domain-containing protein [Fimbriimonas sp.]|nr:MerC domain-containing protein [Fimbriimonas sp.]
MPGGIQGNLGSSYRPVGRSACHVLDRTGSIASIACAIHCALMPFLLAVLPTALGATLGSGWIEWGLFGCSTAMGLTSMHCGRRIHRKNAGIAVCSTGLAILALGRIGEDRHWGWFCVPTLVVGGLLMAAAHFVNMYHCRKCPAC